jgi:hypothetical protein
MRPRRTDDPNVVRAREVLAIARKAYILLPPEISIRCFELFERAGLVPAAIADEMGISDRQLRRIKKQRDMAHSRPQEPALSAA